MNTIETLRTFFGWCAAINVCVLMLSSLGIIIMRGVISKLHGRLFGLSEDDLSRAYFQYLAHFKIAVIVFSVVPYVALCLMN